MARKHFQQMDKILGPPPAPLVEHPKKEKHGFFSRLKKQQPIIIHGPAGGYPVTEFSPTERKEYEELKKHQLELARKEDELAQLELGLKKYEKELKGRFDVSSNVDKARKEYGELSKRLELLTKQVQEKEQLIRELDAQFMLTDKETKSKEKTITNREKEFRATVERFTKEKQAFQENAAKTREEKGHQAQWARALAEKEKELQKREQELKKGVTGQLRREKETLEGDIAALLKHRAQLIEKIRHGTGSEEQKQRKKIESALRGLSTERDRLLTQVRKLKPQADELRKQATPAFYNLEKREKEFGVREQKCALAETKTKKLEEEFIRREFELGKRAAHLAQEEKELDAQQRTLKERLDHENERSALLLTEKEALLKNKYKILEQQLERRAHALHQGEKKYNQDKGRLHLDFEKEREKLHAAIEKERQCLFGSLQQQKDHLSQELIELETRKRSLEHALLEKKETLSDLGETEKLLNEKEEHLLNKIKMLEVDEQRLASREDEIVKRIAELERDKQLLDEKENELIDVLKKLDIQENQLRMHERELGVTAQRLDEKERALVAKMREAEEKLELIKTNTALKQNTVELEKTAVRVVGEIEKLIKKKESIVKIADLQREVETLEKSKGLLARELEKERDALEQEINRLVAKVTDMEGVLVQGERIKQREEFVSRKEEALEQEHQHIQEELHQLDEGSTRAVATMALAEQRKAVAKELFEADSREKVEIYAMIEQARDAIIAGNFDLAKQIYAAIQESYKTFALSDADRHKIYFDVVELKTDIELGALM